MTDLQAARRHYETLPPHVQARKTAAHLLKAIQMAEGLVGAIERFIGSDQPTHVAIIELKSALARIQKPEESEHSMFASDSLHDNPLP